MGRDEDEWIEELESHGLPVFPSAEREIKALTALYNYGLLCIQESFDDGKVHSGKG